MSPSREKRYARLGVLTIPTKEERVSAAEFKGKRNSQGSGDEEWLLEGASWDFDGLFPAGMSRWSFMVGKGPAFLNKRKQELL